MSLALKTDNKIIEIWQATRNTSQNLMETIQEMKSLEGSEKWKEIEECSIYVTSNYVLHSAKSLMFSPQKVHF